MNANGEDWTGYIGNDAAIAALDAGKIVNASNYYGIPHVWKHEEGIYRGCLLQYRSVTEAPIFVSAGQAAAWFEETCRVTDG